MLTLTTALLTTVLSAPRRATAALASPLLATLVLASLSVATPAPAGPLQPADDLETPDAELVTVVYDLDGLWLPLASEQQGLRALPFPFAQEDPQFFGGEDEDPPVDALLELLWTVVAPQEFEYEGRRLETLSDERLLVTAPAPVQAAVQATLDYLRRATQREAVLEIEVWRAAPEWQPAETLDGASLDAAVASGALSHLSTRREALLLGRTERREALTTRSYVRKWESYIAQSAALGVPEVEELALGTRLLLRLEQRPGDDRLTLRFVQQLSELRALEQRTDLLRATLHGETGESVVTVSGVLDQPVVACATLAGSRVLGVGETAVTVMRTRTLDGPVGWVLRYRLLSAEPAPAPLVPALAPEKTIVLADLSAGLWRQPDQPQLDRGQLFPLGGWNDDSPRGTWFAFPAQEREDWNGVLERALQAAGEQVADSSRWLLGSWLVIGGEAGAVAELEGGLRHELAARRSLVVEVALTETGRDGTSHEHSRVLLPLRTDERAFAALGTARLLLVGYGAEIAQGAASPDPLVAGCLDGLVVQASATSDGAVRLELLSHRAVRRERVDLRVPAYAPIDRVELGVGAMTVLLRPGDGWKAGPDLADVAGTASALGWRARLVEVP